MFLPGIKNIRLSVKRNAYITQVYSTTNAKTRGIPRYGASEEEVDAATEHIENIQGIINNVCADYGPVLLVGYQDWVGNAKSGIKSKFTLTKCDGCQLRDEREASKKKVSNVSGVVCEKCSQSIHFGALRGLNEFGHLNTVIILGRNQPSIDAIESVAAAIWWDSDKRLDLTGERCYEPRGYRLANSKRKGVNVMVCKDYRAQFIQHLLRECESLQAIDRIRLIHNETIKNVFLLSNVPLNVTVDELISFKALGLWKTKIEKALMRSPSGVLPLGWEYLVNTYPDLFPGKSRAKASVSDSGLSASLQYIIKAKDSIVFNRKEYHLTTFRIVGEHGNDRKVLSPKRMPVGVLMRNLHGMFAGKVILKETTRPEAGFANIKNLNPKYSVLDDYAEKFLRYRKFDWDNERWYVEVDDDEFVD